MFRKPYFVIICILMSVFIITENSVSTPSGNNILITEILYDAPSSDTTEEWIELFNPTGFDISINGWTIFDNAGSFALSGMISAGGYLVLARDSAGFQALYGFAPDIIMGGALALSNSGDQIRLVDSSSTEIDFVAWENYVAGWPVNAVNEAIRRINEIDTDSGSDWEPSGGIGDPGSGVFTPGGHVLITEVLYDAPTSDATEEWIELYNPNAGSVDISGWTISDNAGTFGLTGSITAKGFLILARNTAAFQTLYGFAPNIEMGGTLALSNSGDQLSLKDSTASEVDFVAWENYVAGWSVSAVDTTIHRITAIDTDSESDWENTGTLGTPGSASFGGGGGPDITPPTVTITSPVNGALLYGTISVSFTSSDASGISANELYLDSNLVSTSNSYIWDTSLDTDGNHVILARSQDTLGNWGEDSISVSSDNTNPPPPTSEVKLMSYNIEGSGLNADWKQVVKEENPDIAVFIETGSWDDNNNLLLDQYCNEFNTYFVGIGEDPYSCVGTTGISFTTSGEAIFSRYPIIATNQIGSVTLDDSSSFTVSHDFLHATLLINSGEVNVIASHLKCCSGAANELKRENAQQGVINYIDSLGDVPVIYAGDLNSFSPEDTYNLGDLNYGPMSMMIKDDTYGSYSQYGSAVTDFYDAHTTLNPSVEAPSYGHQDPIYNSRIDFITVSTHLLPKLVSSTTGDTPTAATGSDHYSVDVILNFGDVADTTPPSQVTGLTAIPISISQIDLNWEANTEPDVASYNIYRDGVFLTSTISTGYSDIGLTESTSYSYEVSAVDTSSNEGIRSTGVNVMTLDTTAPGQPSGLQANVLSESEINLSWNANGESDIQHYNVYRDSVHVASPLSPSYSDTSLSPSTSYTYTVSAVDTSNNEGSTSSPVIATTNDPPTSGLNHILISEVYYDATGRDSQREWIELYNPTTSTVDLTDWYLVDASGVNFVLSGTIGPGQFLIIARNLNGFNSFYGFPADLGNFGFNLNNNGDDLHLFDNLNNKVDFVSWENNTPGWNISASTGNTIARIDLLSDSDTVTDWTVISNQGTPGTQ